MEFRSRIEDLRRSVAALEGHAAAKAAILAELESMARDADADLDTRRLRARALAAVILRERSLTQTPLGQALTAFLAEYAS